MEQFAAGRILRGRYRLERILGRGAMGHVWQGTDVYLERPVAVKTVAADLLALPDRRGTALARFEREAKAAAHLDHANTTTVYDAAVTEDVCCLVMQLVDGTTLDNVVDYAATTDPHLVARLVGELHELLALPLDEGDYALAAAELGMEVGPPEPFSYGAWFQAVAVTLAGG
ncbi:contact-dependent growth inhibition system immunity protein [Streptomyces sp. NPDC088766]|uniref:contact-dependent growth inhibition system immunity protein n=1 Tax=Streptomyces sp. NPDC088766 TaxID=3365893 RepID=UPI00382DEEE1